ncbi:LppX_LprAFG lipoprotein [Streptomyces palmae]|uniref:LppX_LprAFG lipoprotein n=1 Tax=Streptomyces palmae TaxID=1701085 RepID=A0A4Z0GNP6_9ACTN|nr:LppX_LprAFG lipoprotein [Streptomyces palmae]TGA97598.1 LppX_LprAFG lipoprotein [Streptomyces palmae]
MRRSTLTAATAPLLAAALLGSLVGCSADSGGDTDGLDEVSATPLPVKVPRTPVSAATAASGKSSAKVTERIEVRSDKGGFKMTVSGGFDMGRDTGKLTARLPGGAIDHMDEVFAGGKVYLQPLGNLKKGKWAVIPRDQTQAHYLLRAPVNDPEHVLRQISTLRKVKKAGTEKIDGTATTHYTGTLDHATLTMRLEAGTLAKVDAIRKKQGKDLPVAGDAWVDDEGRIRRVRITSTMGGTTALITMDLTDYGTPVKAEAPEKSATVPTENTQGLLPG